MLFRATDNKCEIFISLWEWCPTWCQWCSITNKKTSFRSTEEIKESIDFANIFFDKNFSFFLYSTNNLKNPYLWEIIDYIKKIWKYYRIQIPINSSKKDIIHFKNQEFIISKRIKTKEELKEFFKSFQEFYNEKNIIINYDLLLETKFISVLEKILKINFTKNKDLTFSGKINNIFINIRELYDIDFKEKYVKNLKIKNCFSLDSFEIKNQEIIIKDHIEIDKNLNINFHNPLCYLWNHKISNLKRRKEEIIQDFQNYKFFLEKHNFDFEKNCFSCIQKWFSYENVL